MVSDPIVDNVLVKYLLRSEQGMRKYGATMERKDLTFKQWLLHLQEELMDASLYIEKLLSEINEPTEQEETTDNGKEQD